MLFSSNVFSQGNLRNKYVKPEDVRLIHFEGAGNAGQVMTVSVTEIPYFSSLNVGGGSWSGSAYTVPVAGVYTITGRIVCTASVNFTSILWVNGVFTRNMGTALGATTDRAFVFKGWFNAGDVLAVRTGLLGCTLSNTPSSHFISITKEAGIRI
jgi:hypothetical protein